MSDFVKRLNQLMTEKKISQNKLSQLTGITQSSISDWANGKYKPRQDKVYLLSQALNVSPAYLLGYSDSKNLKSTMANETENEVMELYNKLNKEGQEKVITYIQDLVDSGKYALDQNLSRTTQAEIDKEVEAYRKELELQARTTKSSQSKLTNEEKNKLA